MRSAFLLTVVAAMCLFGYVHAGAEGSNIYFGDLHGHSKLSDGCSPAKNYYATAQSNGLDFAALTDHGELLKSQTWDAVQTLAAQYNAPNSFVTFIGYEWTSRSYGHKTVIFKDADVPALPYDSNTYSTPDDLWNALTSAGYLGKAITIPHHPAGRPSFTRWAYHNQDYQPIVEMISRQGNSEYSVNTVGIPDSERFEQIEYLILNDGYDHSVKFAIYSLGLRLGVIGSTDSHDGNPGGVDSYDTCKTEQKYQGGLVAVLAENLTRDDIWSAIKARRVYATSGPKVRLTFTVNDYPMGSEISLSERPQLHAVAAVPSGSSLIISYLQILKNGAVIINQPVNNGTIDYSLRDDRFASSSSYAVKLKLVDNSGHDERVWSSPIWVDKL
jgi:hypothetical protein